MMDDKTFNEIMNISKVLEASFDLRVQFIAALKDIIKKNNVPEDDVEMVLLAVANMNDEQIIGLSTYAAAYDIDFPGVNPENR